MAIKSNTVVQPGQDHQEAELTHQKFVTCQFLVMNLSYMM